MKCPINKNDFTVIIRLGHLLSRVSQSAAPPDIITSQLAPVQPSRHVFLPYGSHEKCVEQSLMGLHGMLVSVVVEVVVVTVVGPLSHNDPL